MTRFFRHLPGLLVAFFVTAALAHAQGANFVPLAPIPGLTDSGTASQVLSSGSFAAFFNNLYKFLVGLAAALAVIEIVIGGLEWSTAGDNTSKVSKGRERITQAVLGLVLVLSPVLVFSIINPTILNLNVNFQALHTAWSSGNVPIQAPIPSYDSSSNGNAYQNSATYTACTGADCSAAANQCTGHTPGFYTATVQAVCITPNNAIDTSNPPNVPTYFFGLISGSAGSATSCPVSTDKLSIMCTYTPATNFAH